MLLMICLIGRPVRLSDSSSCLSDSSSCLSDSSSCLTLSFLSDSSFCLTPPVCLTPPPVWLLLLFDSSCLSDSLLSLSLQGSYGRCTWPWWFSSWLPWGSSALSSTGESSPPEARPPFYLSGERHCPIRWPSATNQLRMFVFFRYVLRALFIWLQPLWFGVIFIFVVIYGRWGPLVITQTQRQLATENDSLWVMAVTDYGPIVVCKIVAWNHCACFRHTSQ